MTDQTAPLRIDIVSDIVCPWCVIGYRQLAKALELLAAERRRLNAVTGRLAELVAPRLERVGPGLVVRQRLRHGMVAAGGRRHWRWRPSG